MDKFLTVNVGEKSPSVLEGGRRDTFETQKGTLIIIAMSAQKRN
jgi:hypothetical protein